MHRRGAVWASLLAAALITAIVSPQATAATGATCSAASPSDTVDDSAALQHCLNTGGTILLKPGSPGYLIGTGLVVTRSHTTLSSAVPGQRPTLLATPDLAAPILELPRFSALDALTISGLTFDGNRANRTGLATLCGSFDDRSNGDDVRILSGGGHHVTDSTFTHALCGTALQVDAGTFELAGNLLTDNGASAYPNQYPFPDNVSPQSDGITIGYCGGGSIHDNTVVDATDAAIVSFCSANTTCRITDNTVRQEHAHAYFGIQLGIATATTNADDRRVTVSGNTVAGNGLMSFGLAFGAHQSFGDTPGGQPVGTVRGGTWTHNVVSGAFVNFDIEGTQGGLVFANTLSGPRGAAPACNQGTARPANLAVYPPEALGTLVLMVPDSLAEYDGCDP